MAEWTCLGRADWTPLEKAKWHEERTGEPLDMAVFDAEKSACLAMLAPFWAWPQEATRQFCRQIEDCTDTKFAWLWLASVWVGGYFVFQWATTGLTEEVYLFVALLTLCSLNPLIGFVHDTWAAWDRKKAIAEMSPEMRKLMEVDDE